MSGNEEELHRIRKLLEQIIERSFHKVAIPAAWLMLSLCIRKTGVRTMTLMECQKLAKKLRISPQNLQDALWFLHHHVGVLLYYPDIKSLQGTVICDIQVVFDSASNLIKNTFTFDKVGHNISNKFRETGQFSIKDVNNAVSGQIDDLLPLEKLVDLLKDRNVLTVIPPSASSATQESTYFMPCVLKGAKPEELIVCHRHEADPPSLMFRYNCGYFPVGVFPAMITNLVSQMNDWEMISEGLRKNRVQFNVGINFDVVTLISHPYFLEIAISRRVNFDAPINSLCAYVRSTITSTLEAVTSHLNYRFKMRYKFGFECTKHPGKPHICIIAKESASFMRCLRDPKKTDLVPIERHHKVWFSTLTVTPAPKGSVRSQCHVCD